MPKEKQYHHATQKKHKEHKFDRELQNEFKPLTVRIHIFVHNWSIVYLENRLKPNPCTDQLPIQVMLVVMLGRPILPTDVAELIVAAAGHMVAALVLLNDEFALFALTIVQLLLEEHQFLFLAFALVLPQQTLRAKLRLALVADHNPLEGGANEAFAVFLGTEFYVWVFGGDVELVQFSVGPLHVGGELFEEIGVGVEQSVAVFAGTAHFFEGFDFVDGVVVQARLAKALFVLAVAKKEHFLIFFAFHLTFTDLTAFDFPHVIDLSPNDTSYFGLPNLILFFLSSHAFPQQ